LCFIAKKKKNLKLKRKIKKEEEVLKEGKNKRTFL